MTSDSKKTSTNTRTTSKSTVNPVIEGTVNNRQIRTGEGTDKGGSKIAHEIVPAQGTLDKGNTSLDFVPEGTKSSTELLELARKAATAADTEDADEKDRRKETTERSKSNGRDVIVCMLRFIESFNNPDDTVNQEALAKFLDENVGRAHGKANSPFQRLSKYCSVSDTSKAMISKRSSVLDIVVKKKISSNDLVRQYDEPEEIGPEKKKRSGMAKYVMLCQIENGVVEDPTKKIKKLQTIKLYEQATRMLNELSRRNDFSDELLANLASQIKRNKD